MAAGNFDGGFFMNGVDIKPSFSRGFPDEDDDDSGDFNEEDSDEEVIPNYSSVNHQESAIGSPKDPSSVRSLFLSRLNAEQQQEKQAHVSPHKSPQQQMISSSSAKDSPQGMSLSERARALPQASPKTLSEKAIRSKEVVPVESDFLREMLMKERALAAEREEAMNRELEELEDEDDALGGPPSPSRGLDVPWDQAEDDLYDEPDEATQQALKDGVTAEVLAEEKAKTGTTQFYNEVDSFLRSGPPPTLKVKASKKADVQASVNIMRQLEKPDRLRTTRRSQPQTQPSAQPMGPKVSSRIDTGRKAATRPKAAVGRGTSQNPLDATLLQEAFQYTQKIMMENFDDDEEDAAASAMDGSGGARRVIGGSNNNNNEASGSADTATAGPRTKPHPRSAPTSRTDARGPAGGVKSRPGGALSAGSQASSSVNKRVTSNLAKKLRGQAAAYADADRPPGPAAGSGKKRSTGGAKQDPLSRRAEHSSSFSTARVSQDDSHERLKNKLDYEALVANFESGDTLKRLQQELQASQRSAQQSIEFTRKAMQDSGFRDGAKGGRSKVDRFGRAKKEKMKPVKPPPVALNINAVPEIATILEEANMSDYLTRLIRMGITDTRLLLRVTNMDYRMMEMEWDDITSEQITVLKAVVQKYHAEAAAAAELTKEAPRNKERDKLLYGRMVIPGSVQSHEFAVASFGGAVPRGTIMLRMEPEPYYGCPDDLIDEDGEINSDDGAEPPVEVEAQGSVESPAEKVGEGGSDSESQLNEATLAKREQERIIMRRMSRGMNLTAGQSAVENISAMKLQNRALSGYAVVVKRGQCSFLEKALHAADRNASALIIVNDEDRVDAPASGYGLEKFVTDKHLSRVSGLPIFSISNTSWAKLAFALDDQERRGGVVVSVHEGVAPAPAIPVQFIPLKCGGKAVHSSSTSGSCVAVEEHEAKVRHEVTWGTLRIKNVFGETKSFQYLTSNFGSVLPKQNVPIRMQLASPIEGCDTPLQILGQEKVEDGNEQSSDLSAQRPIFGVAVDRGGCAFSSKISNVEGAGASVAVIIDVKDQPLQRVGGVLPDSGYIGIPAVLVTPVCGEFLKRSLEIAASSETTGDAHVTAEFIAADTDTISSTWIDLAFYAWKGDGRERLLQLQSLAGQYEGIQEYAEVSAWVRRRILEIEDSLVATIATDGAPDEL